VLTIRLTVPCANVVVPKNVLDLAKNFSTGAVAKELSGSTPFTDVILKDSNNIGVGLDGICISEGTFSREREYKTAD